MLLHPVRQIRDRCSAGGGAAVQSHAVVEQVGGIAALDVQAVIAHHHAVDDVQLPVDLPQVADGAVVAHLAGHFLSGVLGKQMQMGVNDLHACSSPSSCPGRRGADGLTVSL